MMSDRPWRSLKTRLGFSAAVAIALALLVAGLGLTNLFEHHVERHLGIELESWLNQLAAVVEIGPNQRVQLRHKPREPAFNQPLGGLYWQIDRPDQTAVLRSRSLWDEVLVLPAKPQTVSSIQFSRLPGPSGQTLLVQARRIQIIAERRPIELWLIVARDRAEIAQARARFAAEQSPYLFLIALLLAIATGVQIRVGLAPLENLTKEIESIRAGRAVRLTVQGPTEVQPLINALNDLLAARECAVERARAWTADLAHGIKTPLNALAAEAERLRRAGHTEIADNLEQLAETMRRRVERELIRARVRSDRLPSAAHADLGHSLKRIQQVLTRTPAGECLVWQIIVPDGIQVALMPEDLIELFGNLLENASKWARSRVEIRAQLGPTEVALEVADDGPGVDEAHWLRLGERGLRLDEQQSGYGLGLAIVRDIVDAYGGRLAFGRAELGGLSVRVSLPLAK